MRLAVNNPRTRIQIPPNRPNRKMFIGFPTPAGHNPGAVTTDIYGRSDFR